MSTKYKVVFHNFPACSMLLDEIVMNHSLGDAIEFHTHDSSLQTIEFLKANPEAFLIFFNESTKDYIQAKSMLRQVNDFLKTPISSIAIVNNSDGTVDRSLRELGVKNVFTHDFHSSDIIERMEHFVTKVKGKKTNKEIHQKISQREADDIVNLVIDKNDYRQEEFSKVISDSINAEQINLESGEINIDLNNQKGKHLTCSLENFESNQIELSFWGENNFNENDTIEVNIVFKYNRCKVELLLEGLIQEVEHAGQNQTIVTVKLSHDESVSLENFMSLYQQRQKSINDFMVLAKGH